MHALDQLAAIATGLAFIYLVGLLTWWYCVFFRSEYWTWHEVGQGFIWPWLWVKMRLRQRP